MHVRPLRGSRVAAAIVDGVTVSADGLVPDVIVRVARHVTGLVRDASGAPVAGAEVETRSAASGDPALTAHAGSDRFGQYVVGLPDGTWSVDVMPPVASGLAGTTLTVGIAGADMGLGDAVLTAGILVEGRVLDPQGRPVVDADIDVVDPATGRSLPVAEDRSGDAGRFGIRVPSGDWELRRRSSIPTASSTSPTSCCCFGRRWG